MKSFIALNGKEGTQFELNYHDENTSLYVSLQTRKFDKKIQRYIKETPLIELCMK